MQEVRFVKVFGAPEFNGSVSGILSLDRIVGLNDDR